MTNKLSRLDEIILFGSILLTFGIGGVIAYYFPKEEVVLPANCSNGYIETADSTLFSKYLEREPYMFDTNNLEELTLATCHFELPSNSYGGSMDSFTALVVQDRLGVYQIIVTNKSAGTQRLLLYETEEGYETGLFYHGVCCVGTYSVGEMGYLFNFNEGNLTLTRKE